MKNIKNIIFDYDGTLHNSIKIYGPAFRQAYKYLVDSRQAKDRIWSDNEISKWLGYRSKDMWNSFMPDLSDEEKFKCSNIIGYNMVMNIEAGKAELYEGSIEVLQYLNKKGYKLIFLSNCKVEYMNKHREKFKLDKYFTDFYCTEQFAFISKHIIFDKIKDKYEGEFIIIGDRALDIEIAKIYNKPSIGCNYGFGEAGELVSADTIINDIRELKILL